MRRGATSCTDDHGSQDKERSIRSVANLTRRDGEEFLALAPQVLVRTKVQTYPLEAANDAPTAPRDGNVRGAAVLVTDT
jgi:propanol-preferring alcohol dehydrogenase